MKFFVGLILFIAVASAYPQYGGGYGRQHGHHRPQRPHGGGFGGPQYGHGGGNFGGPQHGGGFGQPSFGGSGTSNKIIL